MNQNTYVVDVPATSANLGPGFDCFGLALQLYNKFLFRVEPDAPEEVSFRANFPLRQTPQNNLIYKAYRYTLDCLRQKTCPGLHISVISNIPSARGLGSSASAVVAGILVAGAVSGINLRLSEAIELATHLEGHPDNVAPAILGGMTVSIQDEYGVYSEKLDWPDDLTILVGIPDSKVRTQAARKVLPSTVSFKDAVFNLRRASLFIAALVKRDWRGLSIAMQDRLHQDARAGLMPGLKKVLHRACEAGAVGAVLSGSGPCVLAVVESCDAESIERVSEEIVRTWKDFQIDATVQRLKVQKAPTKIQTVTFEEYKSLIEPVWGEHY